MGCMLNWGGHFSHENPHLNPISHFSGPNSIFFIKMSCRKWEMGFKHWKSSFPTSDFPFLTSHISFLASCIPYFHSIIILLVSVGRTWPHINLMNFSCWISSWDLVAKLNIIYPWIILSLIFQLLPWSGKQEVGNEKGEIGNVKIQYLLLQNEGWSCAWNHALFSQRVALSKLRYFWVVQQDSVSSEF